MSKALAIFNQAPPPSELDDEYFGGGNIADRVTVPSVGVTGKVWTINYNGEKIQLSKRNEDGDEVPMPVMRVVILAHAKNRGRSYYGGEYSPDKVSAPLCWSDDGIVPNKAVSEPCAKTCAQCPMAVKGSKVTPQGKEVSACSQHRMIVVVPADGLGQFPPLRLKLAITSDYDARSPELAAQGWFAFQQYTDLLRARNVKHTGILVTKMKFDPTAAYPKVIFSPDRWLETSEKAVVGPLSQSPEVAALLGGAWTPAGTDGVSTNAIASHAVSPKLSEQAKAKKPPVQVVEDDDDDVPFEAPKPVKVAAKKPAKVVANSDDDGDEDPAPKKKAKAQVVEVAPESVNSILTEWGDDE